MLDPPVRSRPRQNLGDSKLLSRDVRLQGGGEKTIVVTAYPERTAVFFDFDIHSPIAVVEEADFPTLAGRRDIHGSLERLG